MPGVGFVTVSLRRSIMVVVISNEWPQKSTKGTKGKQKRNEPQSHREHRETQKTERKEISSSAFLCVCLPLCSLCLCGSFLSFFCAFCAFLRLIVFLLLVGLPVFEEPPVFDLLEVQRAALDVRVGGGGDGGSFGGHAYAEDLPEVLQRLRVVGQLLLHVLDDLLEPAVGGSCRDAKAELAGVERHAVLRQHLVRIGLLEVAEFQQFFLGGWLEEFRPQGHSLIHELRVEHVGDEVCVIAFID